MAGGDSVRRKPREVGSATWDDRLTLEFGGEHPSVREITIAPAHDPVTVYLAGNSTVVDQAVEPWAAWGQMIPRFFQPGSVVIANHAESGETLKAFIGEHRLAKVLTTLKRGDYLFVEFAHNDQKAGSSHVEPFTTYKEYLGKFIDEAQSRGATPVLVTSMHRRTFDSTGHIVNTLGDYPAAMRQLAEERHVALIDLNAMSKLFYEALGPVQSLKAFVHYPAGTYPGQATELKDDTHFNNYGAYELARMIVEGLRASGLPLSRFLLPGIAPFDPSHPDPPEADDAVECSVIRKAFRMTVNPGQHAEYQRRHQPVWRELEEVLSAHGAHRYSIFLDETDGSLFGYVEVEDDVRWAAIAETDVCRRWWSFMRDIMPVNTDDSPRSADLREVFHLD